MITCKDCSDETEIIDIVVTYYPDYDYSKLPSFPKLRCALCGRELIWGEDLIKI